MITDARALGLPVLSPTQREPRPTRGPRPTLRPAAPTRSDRDNTAAELPRSIRNAPRPKLHHERGGIRLPGHDAAGYASGQHIARDSLARQHGPYEASRTPARQLRG
jgi:hypothetical protein